MQYQNDYVLRLIEQMGSLIRRALDRFGIEESDEPLELAEEVIGLALSIDPQVVARLSPESLKSLLELETLDDRVLVLVAQALEIEADTYEGAAELVKARLRRDQAAAVRSLMDPSRAN